MPYSACWTTFNDPQILVNIGLEALGLQCQDIICFYHLKTNQTTYHKFDYIIPTCAGVSVLAGHNRFPLFALADNLLRSSIHVIKYADFKEFSLLSPPRAASYIDMRFSDTDLIVALSGFSQYKFYVWNYKTSALLIECSTNRDCLQSSALFVSGNNFFLMSEYTRMQKEVAIWELCTTQDGAHLNEVTKLKLLDDYAEGRLYSMCCADDGLLYMVNDYGVLSSFERGQIHAKFLWSISDFDIEAKPTNHSVYYHKQGVIIVGGVLKISYIKRKSDVWHVEWTISSLNVDILKIKFNSSNDIFALAPHGNLYRLIVSKESTSLCAVTQTNSHVLDYVAVKGIEKQALLLLNANDEQRLVDVKNNACYSTLNIAQSKSVAAHNLLPHAVIGTTNGQLHFINYEDFMNPTVAAIIDFKMSNCSLHKLQMLETNCLAIDDKKNFYLITCDFQAKEFVVIGAFELCAAAAENDIDLLKCLLIESNIMYNFVGTSKNRRLNYANEIWIYFWEIDNKITKHEFALCHYYRDVSALSSICDENKTKKFAAMRLNEPIIDLYKVTAHAQVEMFECISTKHCCNVMGISGTKDLVTWGLDFVMCHFMEREKQTSFYMSARVLQKNFYTEYAVKVQLLFEEPYLLLLYANGCLKCLQINPITNNEENHQKNVPYLQNKNEKLIKQLALKATAYTNWLELPTLVAPKFTQQQLDRQTNVRNALRDLEAKMTALIDHDIMVTGKRHGIYTKFCLDTKWHNMLTMQARKLFELERNAILQSITEQQRIKAWILNLITKTCKEICLKLTALFSKNIVENYGTQIPLKCVKRNFELYRLNMQRATTNADDENVCVDVVHDVDDNNESIKDVLITKRVYDFQLIQNNENEVDIIYKHIMCTELQMQNVDITTANQMRNELAKFEFYINNALMQEFNQQFAKVFDFKQHVLKTIRKSNDVIAKIFENINCMQRLLNRAESEPALMIISTQMIDLDLEQILTINESEIKAINHHKEERIVSGYRKGRMLLWYDDFWSGSLNHMMDGVLEKLWEEEIKKNPTKPDCMLEERPANDLTYAEQFKINEYEQKFAQLQQERQQYIEMLQVQQQEQRDLNTALIKDLNSKCVDLALLKLKYDFALKQGSLRLLCTKMTFVKRLIKREHIEGIRKNLQTIADYIEGYEKIANLWEKSAADIKVRLDTLLLRDKTIEKQFRIQYLNTIAAHLAQEITKLYKKRPKFTQKYLNTPLICFEVAAKIVQKSKGQEFPLPNELNEYFNILENLDDVQLSPNQLEQKHWENFVKLRRQKIENELKIKGTGYQLLDAQTAMNLYVKELENLKSLKMMEEEKFQKANEEYIEILHNQQIQLTLDMSQIEVKVSGDVNDLNNCVLLNYRDIDEINDMIKLEGAKKVRAMEKVAYIRRHILHREWQQLMIKSHVDYLEYMLRLVQKCKVTTEFLEILRSGEKQTTTATTIKLSKKKKNERTKREINKKLQPFRKQLNDINEDIDKILTQIKKVRYENHNIDKNIENLQLDVVQLNENCNVEQVERVKREQNTRLAKIRAHSILLETVRHDYGTILELSTILELQRLRTYPTLCPPMF